MYSQNKEEEIILQYVGNEKGILLDIGANDGKTFSNSLALIERGWGGVLIEPSAEAFNKLSDLHEWRANVFCYNVAIGLKTGRQTFHESGTHLGKGDSGLLSTLIDSEKKRWNGQPWEVSEVDVYTWPDFVKESKMPFVGFDVVTIDAEGMDYEILKQLDIKKMLPALICIEWNSKQAELNRINKLLSNYKLIHTNAENLIYIHAI